LGIRHLGSRFGRTPLLEAVDMKDPIISADGHVNESPEMWARIPEQFRSAAATRVKRRDDGSLTLTLMGNDIVVPPPAVAMDDELRAKEFRNDATGGADLPVRTQNQLLDGAHAEVVFPNTLLCIGSRPEVDLNLAVARAYNDWVHEVFAPEPERYIAAAFVPVDDVAVAVAEAQRCITKGFRTLMLPCSYPWRPYDRPEYAPLWSLIEEAGVVLNFHVFTGNVFFGTDFASVDGMSVEEFAMRRESARVIEERMERLSTTVIGMAAGMGPIVHLTGGGVLERHPRLRFVVTEAEAGWLAWTLHAMDAMQHRRRFGLNVLSMRASDYFRRQGAVTITDDPVAINNLGLTGTDCLMWGNDYPHDEGTYPSSRQHRDAIASATTHAQARAIFAGNAARIYGFDLDAISARIDSIAA
jgi:predicted TIM-barrel fold metal-dependent hydrolase